MSRLAEVLEQLQALTNAERLSVIEAVTRLIREDLLRAEAARIETDRQLRKAAEDARDLYEGGALAEWIDHPVSPSAPSDRLPYSVTVSWSEQDRLFLASVPDLPICVADGATREQAITNIEIVIQEWIGTALALGRTIPPPSQGA